MPELGHALCSPRERRSLIAGGVLIAIDWACSLGGGRGAHRRDLARLYLNPIVNVLLGPLFLRERLSRALNSNF